MSIQRIRISNTIKNLIFNKTFIGKFKMKKALLAVLIPSLLGASSAFAGGIDLIKNDDMTLNFNGDIDLKVYTANEDGEAAGTTLEVIFDDIDFDLVYNINDDLKFIAAVDLTADGSDSAIGTPVETAYAWAGIKTNYGELVAGALAMSFDALGIDNAEIYTGMASGDLDAAGPDHSNAVMYTVEMGDLELTATYGASDDDRTYPKVFQAAAFYEVGDLAIAGGAGKTTSYEGEGDDTIVAEATYFQAQIEYTFGDFGVGLLVSQEDADNDGTDVLSNGVEVDFTYSVTSKLTLNAGADFITQDIEGTTTNDDLTTMYVAAKYKFASNVSLQMELAQKDGDFYGYSKSKVSSYDDTKAGILLNLTF
jgi:hypothetical protein